MQNTSGRQVWLILAVGVGAIFLLGLVARWRAPAPEPPPQLAPGVSAPVAGSEEAVAPPVRAEPAPARTVGDLLVAYAREARSNLLFGELHGLDTEVSLDTAGVTVADVQSLLALEIDCFAVERQGLTHVDSRTRIWRGGVDRAANLKPETVAQLTAHEITGLELICRPFSEVIAQVNRQTGIAVNVPPELASLELTVIVHSSVDALQILRILADETRSDLSVSAAGEITFTPERHVVDLLLEDAQGIECLREVARATALSMSVPASIRGKSELVTMYIGDEPWADSLQRVLDELDFIAIVDVGALVRCAEEKELMGPQAEELARHARLEVTRTERVQRAPGTPRKTFALETEIYRVRGDLTPKWRAKLGICEQK